jgi:hypothetical protein
VNSRLEVIKDHNDHKSLRSIRSSSRIQYVDTAVIVDCTVVMSVYAAVLKALNVYWHL